MAYLVLARKWRPKRFAELVGQEHVVRALTNALQSGRVHHAFLFTGTRGVGKTTISRIFAKSLNCERGTGADPCGECPVCLDVDAGRFVDLIEIDAASHTGVDDVRDLIDNAQYLPSRGRVKVYLIDEVHMLSKAAFNALLKTLEEPPGHVKFLLATTDPQKLPVTVLSRCLQFNLRRLEQEQIQGQMRRIVDAESIAADDAALALLARGADGSLRDGLSLLDQAIAYGGGRLDAATVHAMLGTLDHGALGGVLAALATGDGPALLAQVEAMAAFSPDYGQVLDDLAAAFHAVQVRQLVPEAARPLDGIDIEALASQLAPEVVQLWYQMALTGGRDLGLAPTPRTGFEMALLRMLAFRPAGDAPRDGERAPRPAVDPEPRSVAVPVVDAPRKAPPSPFAAEAPAPRKAPPSPFAEARTDAPRAEAPRPEAPRPEPAGRAGNAALAMPPAPSPTTGPIASNADWLDALQRQAVSGPAGQLAAHARFVSGDAETLVLALDAAGEPMRTDISVRRLAEALAPLYGRAPQLRFVEGAAAPGESLFDRRQRERSERQVEAEARFLSDPVVARLVSQGAQVVEGSIRPIEE
ncbi:MAG: DNA polymerase III subunit gamma/tau [Lysobacteraceae bacterium]|jgi:DNA polymerase-3 subunit gamma/tau|nr:DNA polymerase III subunit gamma/tau [Silanimonas sp.]